MHKKASRGRATNIESDEQKQRIVTNSLGKISRAEECLYQSVVNKCCVLNCNCKVYDDCVAKAKSYASSCNLKCNKYLSKKSPHFNVPPLTKDCRTLLLPNYFDRIKTNTKIVDDKLLGCDASVNRFPTNNVVYSATCYPCCSYNCKRCRSCKDYNVLKFPPSQFNESLCRFNKEAEDVNDALNNFKEKLDNCSNTLLHTNKMCSLSHCKEIDGLKCAIYSNIEKSRELCFKNSDDHSPKQNQGLGHEHFMGEKEFKLLKLSIGNVCINHMQKKIIQEI